MNTITKNTYANIQMQANIQGGAAQTSAKASDQAASSATAEIAVTLVLGAIMLFGVGFANMGIAHNAAHDARHAFAFPCH